MTRLPPGKKVSSLAPPALASAPLRARVMPDPSRALDDELRDAAKRADADAFFALVARGADPTTRDENGAHSLHHAAAANSVAIVDYLLAHGVPWTDVDDDGDCAGQYASGYGHGALAAAMMEQATASEVARGEASVAETNGACRENAESAEYLSTAVRYDGDDKLLDENGDAVMMSWEGPLMEAHADVLCATEGDVMNVGFGMGIIDGFIQERRTRSHTIVEAHPDVRAHMTRRGWDEKEGVRVEFGRWQDVLPKLAEKGVKFDAIFFDTYGEEYDDMRRFHAMLPKLLRKGGVYSYFNGMCPDNIFFHVVYNRVAEIELSKLGFKVTFDMKAIDTSDAKIWEGVKRRYWWGDKYFLPTCVFNGGTHPQS